MTTLEINRTISMLLVRVHIETCKKCQKKYMEILDHIKEQKKEAREP